MGLKDFGKSENEKGKWFPFGDDVSVEDAPFEVRVRRVPNDKVKEISARTGREIMLTVDGVRRPTIERTQEQWTEFLMAQAAWSWSDVRQRKADGTYGPLMVEVADDDGAKLWKGMLKLAEAPAIGSEVEIAGDALSPAVKRRIMTQVRPFCVLIHTDDYGNEKREKVDLSTFLIVKSALLAQGEVAEREGIEGN